MASSLLLASKVKQLSLSTAQCLSLLEHYAKARSLPKINQLHTRIITSSLLSLSSSQSIILRSNLASSYALCGHIQYARKLFDELPEPKLFLYNAIIRMYSQNGSRRDVLRLFVDMLRLGRLFPDNFTYPFVIKACGDMSLLENGVVVHGKVVTSGFGSNIFVLNSLLAMYMNCGEIEMARWVFNSVNEKDMVSWATMISGYLRNGRANDALLVFDEMMNIGAEFNRSSVSSLLSACGQSGNLAFGRKIHGLVKLKGLQDDISVCNALIDMYAKCGSTNEAQGVFNKTRGKDVVTWTTMINGYVLNADARNAFELCWQMQLDGVMPNSVTIVLLLQACATLHELNLQQGKCLHAWVIRRDHFRDMIIETALIDMYAKCNHVHLSFRVFAQSCQKRVAPWNAMISGYMHNGLASNALLFFKQILYEAVHPDVVTISSILPVYADLANVQQSCNIHGYLLRCGFLSKNEVLTGLIDAYSKCGNLESSHKIFTEVPEKCRDITLWSALIAGYGAHGHGGVAVSLLKHMVASGVNPNEVTLTCVLGACSHAGLVDEGFELFKLMFTKCQITPSMHHYTCIIDLLGRAGRLQAAYRLVTTMPFQPNRAVWGALLGACLVHENAGLGELAAKSLIDLEPENTGNYVLLANIYAVAGRWEDAENMRAMINHVRSGKTPGHSTVEVRVI